MGVPAFFTWLTQKYPNIAINLTKDNKILKPKNETQMIEFMHRYLDMLLEYVEPTQLLFIAIDGPPPRAKMMQQRERRFVKDYESRISVNAKAVGVDRRWDSNQITPGTRFMAKVAEGMKKYIEQKLNSTTNSQFKIILSDGSVPGEGEHKILDFIRNLRFRGQYRPNAKHLLFSNDADMIFLTLLLHEQNAYLMRDLPVPRKRRDSMNLFQTKFSMVDFKQLTMYMMRDFAPSRCRFEQFDYDIDRIIDDFVFLAYFAGNDFIPHLPFMNMRDGAYEYLLEKYRQCADVLPSYLVDGCHVNFGALNVYLCTLAEDEEDLLFFRGFAFRDKLQQEERFRYQRESRNRYRRNDSDDEEKEHAEPEQPGEMPPVLDPLNILDIGTLTRADIKSLEYIKYGTKGYRDRYYQCKFVHELESGKYSNLDSMVKQLDMEYLRALSWIQHYYYGGTVSWTWFYPFHYAPMVSDLCKLKANITSDALWPPKTLGAPLTPLTQLSLLMPKNSAKGVIPPAYFDAIFGPKSSVHQYYPDKFAMDLNGKLWNWEAIALMPHVDVDKLERLLQTKEGLLSEQWKEQNKLHHHQLFIQQKHQNFVNQVTHSWGCPVVEDSEKLMKAEQLWRVEIEIPNALKVCSTARKPIDGNYVRLSSQVMYRHFMAGKIVPRDIGFLVKKESKFLELGVEEMRKHHRRFGQKGAPTFHQYLERSKRKERQKQMKPKITKSSNQNNQGNVGNLVFSMKGMNIGNNQSTSNSGTNGNDQEVSALQEEIKKMKLRQDQLNKSLSKAMNQLNNVTKEKDKIKKKNENLKMELEALRTKKGKKGSVVENGKDVKDSKENNNSFSFSFGGSEASSEIQENGPPSKKKKKKNKDKGSDGGSSSSSFQFSFGGSVEKENTENVSMNKDRVNLLSVSFNLYTRSV